MSESRTTARMFHDAGGVEDWRVLFWGACAHYRTRSFADAAKFVAAVAEVADATGHFPDIDLRPDGVTVRTFSGDFGALSERDIELARRVSAVARDLGLDPDPSQLLAVGIAVAQDSGVDVRPFFAAAFGYTPLDATDAVDPMRRGPHLMFHTLDPPKSGRGRFHIDISVPADQAESRVAAALQAGGRIVDESNAPHWWTLVSPENHGVDIAAWPDFENFAD
ncbi:MAG TPA: 4a-hydroxytetrahydrobiopterin dehydratase [Acidimicrobiia bacterium]|nr:4a-hydroxytetrahydrobiopterin dehydratase [Acidimicrobiia bacterium]